jgi:uncharacterized protein (UPF0371 family)
MRIDPVGRQRVVARVAQNRSLRRPPLLQFFGLISLAHTAFAEPAHDLAMSECFANHGESSSTSTAGSNNEKQLKKMGLS